MKERIEITYINNILFNLVEVLRVETSVKCLLLVISYTNEYYAVTEIGLLRNIPLHILLKV